MRAASGNHARRAPPGSAVAGGAGAGNALDVPAPKPVGIIAVVGWTLALVAVTAGMLAIRGRLNEAHVALLFLLVILGASAHVGRALGLALATAAFVLFDWFFLPPYGTLVITNPLNWLVLIVFFATSAVAAQLLYRARAEADAARARTAEIDRLAVLGAETLNAGRAEEALVAVASVIRGTVGVDWCEVYTREQGTGRIVLAARSAGDPPPPEGPTVIAEGQLVHWVAEHGTEASVLMDGTSRVALSIHGFHGSADPAPSLTQPDGQWAVSETQRVLFLPLHVRERIVGVLAIGAEDGLELWASQRRVLRALSYYAALGVERVRLVRDSEHAEALRQADQLKDAVLASVSHDLRTPLTTIKALANAIAQSGDDRAATIEEEADRLNGLVENLLDLSHPGRRASARAGAQRGGGSDRRRSAAGERADCGPRHRRHGDDRWRRRDRGPVRFFRYAPSARQPPRERAQVFPAGDTDHPDGGARWATDRVCGGRSRPWCLAWRGRAHLPAVLPASGLAARRWGSGPGAVDRPKSRGRARRHSALRAT